MLGATVSGKGMAIKLDLTEEPCFGIIRRWVLRQRIARGASMGPSTTLDLTAEIVALHVMGRAMPQIELTLLIQAVHGGKAGQQRAWPEGGTAATQSQTAPSPEFLRRSGARSRNCETRAICTPAHEREEAQADLNSRRGRFSNKLQLRRDGGSCERARSCRGRSSWRIRTAAPRSSAPPSDNPLAGPTSHGILPASGYSSSADSA